MKNIKEMFDKFKKDKENGTILKGVGKIVYFDEKHDSEVLVIDLGGIRGVILKEELDSEIELKSIVNFIGREISFVVTDVTSDEVICSRAKAQELQRDTIMEKLANGEIVEGKIVNILKHGAYVEIDGAVSGLLKNTDFAEDYTSVGEVHKLGDRIKVKYNKTSEKGTIILEAASKFKSPTIIDIDNLSRDQVILGVIRDIKISGEVFVQIGPNLDALCGVPPTGELDEDKRVQVRLTKVDKENRRVRGRILKVLD